ncbi:hypothetical protein RF11_06326 [Thelohanellus kitauei]|uniref:Sortilin C-terminal domain-containing protein n=1 Tax=Thelohanellus kitauei TaxID=669202 RepID=A0A0C2MS90_THEKT|nr:hypothetical protein RF11_06326 [Thelohanellus kitauei]
MGVEWTELNIQRGMYNTHHLIKGQDSAKFKFLTFLQTERPMDLDKKCEHHDFTIYSPGSNSKSPCFHGARETTYLKIPDRICQIDYKNLPIIKLQSCECSPEDYKWYVVYHFFSFYSLD